MEKPGIKYPYIVITGPESTGKTELAQQLANALHCDWIPELSREFIANLGRPYNYSDVETIAKQQISNFEKFHTRQLPFAIFDTGLIITKVWFDVVYKQCPDWLIRAIEQQPKIPHLLCATDLPWVADEVRENGGAMREKLFKTYLQQLIHFGFPHAIVKGTGVDRLENALRILGEFEINQS